MVRVRLKLHPDSRCGAITRIDVDVTRPQARNLMLRYCVTGNIGALRLPPPGSPTRTDELWRHTCFEAFVRGPPDAGYHELNFAPSGQWAAYRFGGYRSGMRVAEIGTPAIEATSDAARFELRSFVALGALADLPDGHAWRIGISAVMDEMDSSRSYWALAHPAGKPDFHHDDCFALDLPPQAGP
jgi:hypothetical protein